MNREALVRTIVEAAQAWRASDAPAETAELSALADAVDSLSVVDEEALGAT